MRIVVFDTNFTEILPQGLNWYGILPNWELIEWTNILRDKITGIVW